MGFCALILPGRVLQLLIAFVFSLLCMLLTAIASPFKSDVDDSVAKAFGFALAAVFFFALIIKVNVLTESMQEYLTKQLHTNFVLEKGIVSAGMTIAVALALVVTVFATLQQFVHAARTPITKLRSTLSRPAPTVNHGITWHLFLSQCVSASRIAELAPPASHELTRTRAGSCSRSVWSTGQDQCATIKRQLSLLLPGVSVFLDVDDAAQTTARPALSIHSAQSPLSPGG